MKPTALFLTLISLSLGFTSVTQAAVGIVPLGDLQFTSAVATENNFLAGFTIDGLDVGASYNNGWTTYNNKQHIDWTWEAHTEPSLLAGESVSHYTYTINLSSGLLGVDSNTSFRDTNYLIRAISLALRDSNTDNFTTITDYQSLSNTQEAQDHDHTISVDSYGLITTTEPNAIIFTDTYTVVFNSPTLENNLRLDIDPALSSVPGWSTNGFFNLREITGSVTANVVPEPSAYALILGLITLGFAFKRRK